MIRALLLAATPPLIAFTLAACGQKGPLKLPETPPANPAATPVDRPVGSSPRP